MSYEEVAAREALAMIPQMAKKLCDGCLAYPDFASCDAHTWCTKEPKELSPLFLPIIYPQVIDGMLSKYDKDGEESGKQ